MLDVRIHVLLIKMGNFATESGKCEFILKDAKNFVAGPFRQMYDDYQPGQDLPPLPDYVPPYESHITNPNLAKKYPFKYNFTQKSCFS